ncbi:MAG: hypothetical protein RL405_921, partial [Actinomycetota bacterium]
FRQTRLIEPKGFFEPAGAKSAILGNACYDADFAKTTLICSGGSNGFLATEQALRSSNPRAK